jgi:hypothetical protein
MFDCKRIKKQIQAESELYIKFGPSKIWSFILEEIFNNDTRKAIAFMLSPEGGFTLTEVTRIISQKETHKNIYMKKLICGLEA